MPSQSVEVPFIDINGRKGLTGLQMLEHPELAAFVKRYEHCFERPANMDVVILKEGESLSIAKAQVMHNLLTDASEAAEKWLNSLPENEDVNRGR